jgi:signal transduction histidine kinase
MANSLLSISRLEDGNALQKSTFDLSEMIRRIIIGFEKQLSAKEVEGDLTIPESLTVVADHDALFQVIYNLMDNALKFIDQGGTLTVYLEEAGGKARFHIINTGGEIPPDQLPHIFERFYKGDSARTGVKNGSGLGLYIVKTVINKHGGDVYAKSGDGKTEFCFSLPIGKP